MWCDDSPNVRVFANSLYVSYVLTFAVFRTGDRAQIAADVFEIKVDEVLDGQGPT